MLKIIRPLSCFLIFVLLVALFLPGTVAGLEGSALKDIPLKKGASISDVSVPNYDGGSASSWMIYDCGAGVTLTDTSVESKMRIISGTDKTEFNAYVTKLQDQGYTKIFARKITGVTKENIYGKFLSSDGSHSVYVALFPYLNQVRIVVDNNVSTLGRYNYTAVGSERTELYLYSLSQPHDGWGTGSDEALITQYRSGAGSMLFMKMSDNSLYIIDGGSANQMGDRACQELYAFLRSVTCVPEGQKMTINTWHVSHPHSDHITGFTRFISMYHQEFDLLNVLYNFDIESTSRSYLQTVARLYPDVGYYKPHTGDQYTVSGITFDVLYTTEDRYQPNSSNKLLLGDESCIAYTHENNTSMVVQVQMDGKKVLLTGDLQKADATLMAMYPASVLQSDVFQIPHHGIDNHTELAKTVAPAIGFTNQSKKAVMSRERYYTNNSGWYPYIGKIYYAGTETVGYAADSGVFYRKAFEGYDYLKWSDKVYDLRKANPQTGENPVKDPETYYRYTQATGIKTSNWPYIIVDDKLGRVLSYDAVGDGGVTDALPAFYDGTHYYFSDSQRRLVNWLIKYTTAGTKSDAAVSSAETTYYEKVMIKKWHDDYWGTPTKNHAIIIGKDDTFTSEGMFDTWASFSQQVDTTSNSTWIDKLSDNTFVIYRNNNGTYYPLYRDGNIAEERGWGTSKLTQSKINSMRKYVKTRLYSYETTPSNMLLSWTGHRDYYVQTGISEKDLINLLISDIRVTYSFDAFDGTGEIYHTSQNKKDPGTYWLTYSTPYTPSVAQDYTVTINYRSANGAVMAIGTFTLHTEHRSTEETQTLYFDFADTASDRERYYEGSQYGGTNYDGTSRWSFTNASGYVDKEAGTLVYTIPTTGNGSYSAQTYCLGNTPLSYDPTYGQVAQIRFRSDNLKIISSQGASLQLWYIDADGSGTRAHETPVSYSITDYDGIYGVITVPLGTCSDTVKGLKIEWSGLIPDAEKQATISIDYLYVGPDKYAPQVQPLWDPNLKLGHTLNLASDISVNFAVAKPLLTGYDLSTLSLECTLPIYEGNTKTGEKTVSISPVENGEYYYFTLTGLTAVRMNDSISSVLYGTKNGQAYYSATDEYSIATYAYSQMNKEGVPATLKTLCADLLRYGSMAQVYKGYRTEALADSAMTDIHRAYLSDIEAVGFGNTNTVLNDLEASSVTWVGKSLNLDSKVELKFIFSLKDYTGDLNALTLHIAYRDIRGNVKTATVENWEIYNAERGYYAFTVDALLAAELRTVVSAQIYADNAPVSCTLQYTADTYGNNKTGALGDLCKALFAYSDSAKAYFNS